MLTRVYIQSELLPDIKLVEIDENATIDELKQSVLTLLPSGTDLNELTLSIEDDDKDACAKATKVKHLKKEHGTRIHLHRCKHIDVYVRFSGDVLHHQFSPATTVGHVRKWAGYKLGMQQSDIAEHVLQITGTNEQPDVDVDIGTLTKCPECSVSFDLVPAHRING